MGADGVARSATARVRRARWSLAMGHHDIALSRRKVHLQIAAGYRHTGPGIEQKSHWRISLIMDLTSSLYCFQTTQSGRTFVAGTLPGSLVPADSGPTSPRTVRGPE